MFSKPTPNMKTITKNSNQLPGHIKLIAIPVWNINSIINGNVNVKSNDDVFLIECSHDTLNHDAKLEDTDNGKFYTHDVSAVLQGENDTNDYLDLLSRNTNVLLMQTDNGSWIRVGDLDNGLSLTFNYSSEKPGYNISFTGELLYKSKPNSVPAY